MTVQHLGPLHEAERAEDRHYQESSPLLHSTDGNTQENSHLLLRNSRKILIFMFFIAAAFVTRGLINKASPSTNATQFSLWLIPPPSVTQTLEPEISFLSDTYGGPSFGAHVTVVGGISFDSIDDAKKFVHLLQDELKGFGEVDAVFQPKAQNFDVWSQGLVVKMEPSPKFIYLCQIVRRMLNMDDTTSRLFPTPANAPHLTLFYGVDNVPNADHFPDDVLVHPVPNFSSNTLSLWKTDPATLEGVPQWEYFDEISLV